MDSAEGVDAEPVGGDAAERVTAEPTDSPAVPEERMRDTAAKLFEPARSAAFGSLSKGGYGASVAVYLAGLVLSLIACVGSIGFVFSAISCAVGAFVLYHVHGSEREQRLLLMIPIIWALSGSIVYNLAYSNLQYMSSTSQGLFLQIIVRVAFYYIGPLVFVHLALNGRSAERSRRINMITVVYMAVLAVHESLSVFSQAHFYGDTLLWFVGFATSSLTLPVAYLLVAVELYRRSQEGRQRLAFSSDGLATVFRVSAVEVEKSVANAAIQHAAAGAGYHDPADGERLPEAPDYRAQAGLDYKRLGGWLLFYMVMKIISGASAMFGGVAGLAIIAQYKQIIALYTPQYTMISGGFFALLEIGGFLLIIFGGVRLWMAFLLYRRDPRFLKASQITHIAALAVSLLYVMSVVGRIYEMFGFVPGFSYQSMYLMATAYLLVGVIEAVCWVIYFCKSVRMRIYMGSEEYLERALFRFDRT